MKIKKCFCVFVLCTILSAACAITDTTEKVVPASDSFDYVVKRLNSPKRINEYMMKNIHYTSVSQRATAQKNGYWWKTPQETFNDKHGFCYDLSTFALYCLIENQRFDLDPKLLFVCAEGWGRKSKSGHFVCMFKNNEKYYAIDNGMPSGPFENLDQLIVKSLHGLKLKNYRFFDFKDIPFHTPYGKMDYFCSSNRF